MKIPIYQVDAFTNRLFGGNPAAVCPLEKWIDTELLQNIAAENNLSETAFFVKKGDDFEIKWFTPTIEVDLCGHATLATAHVIFNYLAYNKEKIIFYSNSGKLIVTRSNDLISLDFPVDKPVLVETTSAMIDGLGVEPIEVYKSSSFLALLKSEEEVLSIKPKFEILEKLDCVGIIITAEGNDSDFVSRFFAPRAGIPEDPVTGSAHCTLIPYWAEKLNKSKLHAYQVSKRKGELFCENLGDRVSISGKATTYLIGSIEI
ncbi:MAG: PhzF family phenazine biosynthesis protein [Bacteroidota bacterium]